MIAAFIYGIILAWGLILPLGVQNIFLFNQGASQRHFLHAMPSVLAAFFCDAILITLAVTGVSLVVLTIPWLEIVIFIIGFFFLIYMGWVTWHKHNIKTSSGNEPLSAKKQIAFALSVSLLNPHAIIDSVAVIGTNALHFAGYDRVAFTVACILVSGLWFFTLSVLGHFLHRLDKSGIILQLVNKLSALIIWSVAAFIAWKLLSMAIF